MKKHEPVAMRLQIRLWHKVNDQIGAQNVDNIEGGMYVGYQNYMMWIVLRSIRSGNWS